MAIYEYDETDYGLKEPPYWMKDGFKLPGYRNAFLSIVSKETKEEMVLDFKVSPSSYSEARGKLYQQMKTMAGWFIQKLGKNPIEISISGYLLDTATVTERHDFLQKYLDYIEDQKNFSGDYFNKYYTKLTIEGREYVGIVASLSLSKNAAGSPFLYSYGLSFVALKEVKVYDTENASLDARILAQKDLVTSVKQNMILPPNTAESLGMTESGSNDIIKVSNIDRLGKDSYAALGGGVKDTSDGSSPASPQKGSSLSKYTNTLTGQYITETINLDGAKISRMNDAQLKELYEDYGINAANIEIGGTFSVKIVVIPPMIQAELKNDAYSAKQVCNYMQAQDGICLWDDYGLNDWASESTSQRRTYYNTLFSAVTEFHNKCLAFLDTIEKSSEPNATKSSAKKLLYSIISQVGIIKMRLEKDEEYMDNYMRNGGFEFRDRYIKDKKVYQLQGVSDCFQIILDYLTQK